MDSNSGRKIDLEELRNAYNNASSTQERADIQHAAKTVMGESKKIESMREALIKARRNNNIQEVKDINNFVRTHKEYQNER